MVIVILSSIFAGILLAISITLFIVAIKILFMSKEEFEHNRRKYSKK